jgi:hypothetical protein
MIHGLDSWQAMALDVTLATKFSILEKEEEQTKLEVILGAIDNVMRVQGAKVKKRKPTKSLIRPYRNPKDIKAIDDLPNVADVISQLSGGTTIVNMEGIFNG